MLQDFTDDNKYPFRLWLGAVRQESINLTSVGQDMFRHIHSADQILIALGQMHTKIFEL